MVNETNALAVTKATAVSRIQIEAEQAAVFKYLANLKYHTLWNPHLRKISSSKRLRSDSTYTTYSMVLNIRIRAKNTVSKFDAPNQIEISNITGTIQYKVNFRTKKLNSGTIVTCTSTVSTDNKAHIFTVPILKRLVQHELQSDLRALKIAVEHHLV